MYLCVFALTGNSKFKELDHRLLYMTAAVVALLMTQKLSSSQRLGGGRFPDIDRVSFRTNAVDWLLTVPNFEVGYDLSASEYNNKSILAGIKYNWDTYHKLPPYYVFNVLDLRGEYRYHFRSSENAAGKWYVPKPWMAQYLGGYVDWSSFSVKPGQTGKQGWQAGLGASYGVEFPLYEYGSSAIDMELGVSAGISVQRYLRYTLTTNAGAYVVADENKRTGALPVIVGLRASFSWRKASVRTKYTKTDPEIPVYNLALKDIDATFASTRKADFDDYQKSIGRLGEISRVDTTYRGEFTRWVRTSGDELVRYNISTLPVNDKRKEKLVRHVKKLEKSVIAEFDAAVREEKASAEKSRREAVKQEEEETR